MLIASASARKVKIIKIYPSARKRLPPLHRGLTDARVEYKSLSRLFVQVGLRDLLRCCFVERLNLTCY
ncbi:hypothetical protein NQ315_000076 [Exocentrus adspersus]|uniref:Uncharacterized protein n=1 Tax=Exocentrus adspersus TaxID=1586481 RepID=A0AAV8VTE1_9CUCU|nr:hypothetical protein NQ315_000076 [Exocentrus adspersus]